MSRLIYGILVGLAASIAVVVGTGCSNQSASASSVEAPTPSMPAYWKVTSDFEAPIEQIKPIAESHGGEVAAVRNTIYDVKGKRVQVNTIVATDAANADKIWASLKKIKSEVALLRAGVTFYEFVGKNDVLPAIGEGKRHLQKAHGNTP